MTQFTISVLLLAALLYYHTSKLIWVLGVRRVERKESRKLSEDEIRGQLRRARLLTVPVVLTFSYLFNLSVFGNPAGG